MTPQTSWLESTGVVHSIPQLVLVWAHQGHAELLLSAALTADSYSKHGSPC